MFRKKRTKKVAAKRATLNALSFLTIQEMAKSIGRGYNIIRQIGSGGFGNVYIASRLRSKYGMVAIKVERKDYKSVLEFEKSVYKNLGPSPYIPSYYMLEELKKVKFLVLELLGPNLYEIFQHNNKQFSIKTNLLIAIQIMKITTFIHNKRYIHGDIKPENFVIRMDKNKTVSIVICDLGLASKWCDHKTRKHIPYRKNCINFGTQRFMSINNHLGKRMSRRDDLEALVYLYAYFLKGLLPWQTNQITEKVEISGKVLELKKNVTGSKLFGSAPIVYKQFRSIVKGLNFNDVPPYDSIIERFESEYMKNGFKDLFFDWNLDFEAFKQYEDNKLNEIPSLIGSSHSSTMKSKILKPLLSVPNSLANIGGSSTESPNGIRSAITLKPKNENN